MEEWQRAIISENMTALIDYTNVSISLLTNLFASNILSNDDVERISCSMNKSEKAFLFYKVLCTRSGGYEALVQALSETNQSGVVQILTNSKRPVVIYGHDNAKTEEIEIQTPSTKFKDAPNSLTEFFNSAHHTLILYTIDYALTMEKITQNCNDYFTATSTASEALATGFPLYTERTPEQPALENDTKVAILLSKQLVAHPFSLQNFLTRGTK